MRTKKTNEQFKKEIKDKYNDRIECEEEYINARTKLWFHCNVCGYRFQQTPNGMLRKGVKNGCDKCGHKGCKALSQEVFVSRMTELYGDDLEILTEYKTHDDIVECKCKICNKINKKTARDWLHSNGGCMYCRGTKVHIEDYKERMAKANNNVILIEFNGASNKNKFHCNKHNIDFERVWQGCGKETNHICPKCGLEARSRENHYEYKGTSEIAEYCRKLLRPLKLIKFAEAKGVCSITEVKGEMEIHHILPFSFILRYAHEINNIEIKEKISEYSNEELIKIQDTIITIHKEWDDVWIVVSKDLHRKFHNISSYKEFTKEDWYEFIKGL